MKIHYVYQPIIPEMLSEDVAYTYAMALDIIEQMVNENENENEGTILSQDPPDVTILISYKTSTDLSIFGKIEYVNKVVQSFNESPNISLSITKSLQTGAQYSVVNATAVKKKKSELLLRDI